VRAVEDAEHAVWGGRHGEAAEGDGRREAEGVAGGRGRWHRDEADGHVEEAVDPAGGAAHADGEHGGGADGAGQEAVVAKEEARRADERVPAEVPSARGGRVDLDGDGGARVVGERGLAHTEEEAGVPRRVEAARVVGAGLELVPRVDPGHGVRVQPPPRQARVGLLEPLRGDEGHLQQPLALRESQPCLLVRRLHRRRAAELGFFSIGGGRASRRRVFGIWGTVSGIRTDGLMRAAAAGSEGYERAPPVGKVRSGDG